jgi:hypothetical protein
MVRMLSPEVERCPEAKCEQMNLQCYHRIACNLHHAEKSLLVALRVRCMFSSVVASLQDRPPVPPSNDPHLPVSIPPRLNEAGAV